MYAQENDHRAPRAPMPSSWHQPKPLANEPKGGKHTLCATHVRHAATWSGWLCVRPAKGQTVEERTEEVRAVADHLAKVQAWHRTQELARLAVPGAGKIQDATREELLPRATKPTTTHYDPAIVVKDAAWQPADEVALQAIEAKIAATSDTPAPTVLPSKATRPVPAKRTPRPTTPKVVAIAAPKPTAVPTPSGKGRRSCPRCGQTFRAKGNGLDWHLTNRPNCAREKAAAA